MFALRSTTRRLLSPTTGYATIWPKSAYARPVLPLLSLPPPHSPNIPPPNFPDYPKPQMPFSYPYGRIMPPAFMPPPPVVEPPVANPTWLTRADAFRKKYKVVYKGLIAVVYNGLAHINGSMVRRVVTGLYRSKRILLEFRYGVDEAGYEEEDKAAFNQILDKIVEKIISEKK